MFRDRRKRIELFGGNLSGELVFALTLGAVCRAYGVGAAEAVLTAGLVGVGVDESTAFAIAITHWLCTNYLPPIWGYFALRWLRRQAYL